MRTCLYEDDFEYPETKMHFHLYNTDFPELHDHDYWEFFIILSGSTEHHMQQGKRSLKSGMGCLVHPWDKHRFGTHSTDYEQLNVAITDDYFHELLDFIDPKLYDNLSAVGCPVLYELDESSLREIRKNVHSIQITGDKDRERFSIFLKLIWLDIVKLIYRSEVHANDDYPKWLNDFIQAIHRPENIARPVGELHRLTYFSYRHLTRLFKQYTGETLNDYLLRTRLHYGAMLLRTTDMGILNISSALGYDSLSHFIRMFKKYFKMTPKQYRKSFAYNEKKPSA